MIKWTKPANTKRVIMYMAARDYGKYVFKQIRNIKAVKSSSGYVNITQAKGVYAYHIQAYVSLPTYTIKNNKFVRRASRPCFSFPSDNAYVWIK